MTPRWLLLVAALLLTGSSAVGQSLDASPPNVVLIITDDLGWSDIGSYGAADIETPHIDALAQEGVRMTDFYANAPLCSPTRAGLMMGRYQQRHGVEVPLSHASRAADAGLAANGRSLPQLLKDGGYATGLIGKWHLGYTQGKTPNDHGFDYFFGLRAGYHDYYTHRDRGGEPDLWENNEPVEVEGYTTDLITERAIGFIEKNADRPFFIDVAYNAPHWPYQPPDDPTPSRDSARHLAPTDSATSTRGDYVRMVERVDDGVGHIMSTLEGLGLSDNTIVIFTNDNGGEWLADNQPLFNRKWTLWEGGIRVPTILRWKGRVPEGSVSDQVGMTMDLTASILAVSGVPIPEELRLDGMDLLPIITGQAPEIGRTLFWRTDLGGFNQKAVRHGDWKLVRDGLHTYLYDVRRDLGERNDLANQRQDVARKLRGLLDAWESDVDAEPLNQN